MKPKVAERGQVAIPKELRTKLGIRPGTLLEFSEKEGRLIALKTESLDTIDKVYIQKSYNDCRT